MCYAIFGLIVGAFGAICYTQAVRNNDFTLRYDDICLKSDICTISFSPDKDLEKPKIYYRLENFYANHRNFVKSRSFKQLRGKVLDKD